MNNLEKIYKDYFKDTFDKLGLGIYETSNGQIKFKNSKFRLQLLDDRGLIETGLSPLHGQEIFRGIESYNSLLTLKRQTKLNDLEKKKNSWDKARLLLTSKVSVRQFRNLKSLIGQRELPNDIKRN